MKMNRKAEGGFAELMMAMAVATIALCAFMAAFVYSLNTEPARPEISTEFVRGISIENGEFAGIDESYVKEECIRCGYSSMVITLETAGSINHAYLRIGESYNSDFSFTRGTAQVPCSDGSVVLVTYEVVAFV